MECHVQERVAEGVYMKFALSDLWGYAEHLGVSTPKGGWRLDALRLVFGIGC